MSMWVTACCCSAAPAAPWRCAAAAALARAAMRRLADSTTAVCGSISQSGGQRRGRKRCTHDGAGCTKSHMRIVAAMHPVECQRLAPLRPRSLPPRRAAQAPRLTSSLGSRGRPAGPTAATAVAVQCRICTASGSGRSSWGGPGLGPPCGPWCGGGTNRRASSARSSGGGRAPTRRKACSGAAQGEAGAATTMAERGMGGVRTRCCTLGCAYGRVHGVCARDVFMQAVCTPWRAMQPVQLPPLWPGSGLVHRKEPCSPCSPCSP